MYEGKCTIIVPARNEERTIAACCRRLMENPRVSQVIVIANACGDDTAKNADIVGVDVIETATPGKGFAIKAGLNQAREKVIVTVDGDVTNPTPETVTRLLNGLTSRNVWLAKGHFDRSAQPGYVTDMLVKPVLQASCHPAKDIKQPLSGMVAARTDYLHRIVLPDDFGIELAMLLGAYALGGQVVDVEIPPVSHAKRSIDHYVGMAHEVAAVLRQYGLVEAHGNKP